MWERLLFVISLLLSPFLLDLEKTLTNVYTHSFISVDEYNSVK